MEFASLKLTNEKPPLGRVGRFELQSELGQGASGRVYLAHDLVIGRQVALKVPHVADDNPDCRRRFLNEAKAAARLRHPAIVAVYESGQAGAQFYIASEFVAGQSLEAVLAASRPELRSAVEWVRQIALALDYAHSAGIVHRDVKPGNILIDNRHQARLTDFGLSRDYSLDCTLTTEGTLLGTPAYIAPEQARGERSAVGSASDQYSLGVVLYELLTGQRPFDGPPHVIIPKVMGEAPIPPRRIACRIPRDLSVACLKCLAKAPEDRYRSCLELADDLSRWLNGDSIAARHPRPWETLGRWARRNRLAACLSAVVVVLLATIAFISTASAIRLDRDRAEIAESLVEANRQHEEQQRQSRLAHERLQVVEEQKRLAAAHARTAVEAEVKVQETLVVLQSESQRLDELVANRETELLMLSESQMKSQKDKESLERGQTAFKGTVQALRDDLQEAHPLTRYAEMLQLAALALKARDLDEAQTRLLDCSQERRDWEWKYLLAQCDPDFSAGWTAAEVKVDYCPNSPFDGWSGSGPHSTRDAIRRSNYDEYFGRRQHQYVQFSLDGKLVACISEKRLVKVLDATTGEIRRLLSPLKDDVRPDLAEELWLFAVTFSRNGRRIVALAEHDVLQWEIDPLAAVPAGDHRAAPVSTWHKTDAYYLASHLGPDDRIPVISWTGERKNHELFPIQLQDAASGKDWHGLARVAGNVFSNSRDLNSSFSADGRMLLVNFRSRATDWQESTQNAQIDLKTGAVESRIDPKVVHASSPSQIAKDPLAKPVAFSPSRRRIIDERGICDVESGALLLPMVHLFGDAGMVDDHTPFSFDWSLDGKRIAIKAGRTVRIVAIPDGQK